MTLKDLTPFDVSTLLAEEKIVLVDVREAKEWVLEHIDGALHFPLSSFDPQKLSTLISGMPVVFMCAAGVRSVKAVELCQSHGLSCDQHLQGGLQAWKLVGLPTVNDVFST